MNTQNLNPLQRAAAAAWAELTTDEACQWYIDRAWNDTLTTAEAFRRACLATIALGQFCRCLVEDWLHQPVAMEAVVVASSPIAALPQIKLPPAPLPIAALPPAKTPPAAPASPIGETSGNDHAAPSHKSVAQLRELCTQQGIAWNRAGKGGRHLNRREMLQALSLSGLSVTAG